MATAERSLNKDQIWTDHLNDSAWIVGVDNDYDSVVVDHDDDDDDDDDENND